MKRHSPVALTLFAGALLAMNDATLCLAQTQQPPIAADEQKKGTKMAHASGTFDVKVTPQAADEKAADPALGRFSIDKQFHGELDGTSKGEMLTAGSVAKGSAGYVAMEKVTAKLQGLNGTFVFQHSATMTPAAQRLSVTVVPGSGTDQLAGIAGSMTIKIEGGKHFYEFEYTLPEIPEK
jgi:hypothetical protein